MTRSHLRRLAALVAALPWSAAPAAPPTFTRDIAPIIQEHCATCHRPGESAPFDLLTYDDVRKRGRQIVMVTESRYMPPWLPAPGPHAFVDARGLTDEQIAMIAQWVKDGAVEGDPADLPPAPTWTEGWQLGEPDLVVSMDETYVLRAEGTDVFRNFVLPIPIDRARWVRAVELRPGNPKVVHHAVMQIDDTGSTRRLDEMDPGPGFEGMNMGRSHPPDGHFLGWTPGKQPFDGGADMAWRLRKGAELVVQLHLVPSGKPEELQPMVGFHFAEGPPAVRPVAILLRNDEIDIPPGTPDFVIEDSFETPVAVHVTGVYPHAHYLGKRIEGFATLPDGTTRSLIDIPDWDFNWQDEYRFADPVALPAGSRLHMRFTYDNSAENVRNPSQPPQRVVFGERSIDEMGTFTYQLLPADATEHGALVAAYRRASQDRFITYATRFIEKNPRDGPMLEALASAYVTTGRLDLAEALLKQALRWSPDYAAAYATLGGIRGMQGNHEKAIQHFERALELRADHADTYNNLGVSYLSIERYGKAHLAFQRAIALEPEFVEAHVNFASVLTSQGRGASAIAYLRQTSQRLSDARLHHALANLLLAARKTDEAIVEYEKALRLSPRYAAAHFNLASARLSAGDVEAARRGFEATLEHMPTSDAAMVQLGNIVLREGKTDEAMALYEQALELNPENAEGNGRLAGIEAVRGNRAASARHFREAVRLAPNNPGYLNGLAWILATTGDPAVRDPKTAVQAAERVAQLTRYGNASVLDTLAAAYAAAGRFDRAIQTIDAALGIASTNGDQKTVEKLRGRKTLYVKGEAFTEAP
jgi:tetratricopeptide (TPR) repeat protein/mono/diheme cytochrome c family protein